MTPRYGIDTSILVRLVTGDPEDAYRYCVDRLTDLIESTDGEILASGQVIGEAYVAVQHHYGVAKKEARQGLKSVLTSGLVAPVHRTDTLRALNTQRGSGLLDRLICIDYGAAEFETLTLDRRMARLKGARRL